MSESLHLGFDQRALALDRLDAVLVHGAGPRPLEANEKKMLGLLKYHLGAARAIRGAEIAEFLHCDEREVKAIAKTLVEIFALPIGASRVRPYGYYIIETAAEMRDVVSIYEHEIRSLAQRVRALEGSDYAAQLLGQIALECQEEKSA